MAIVLHLHVYLTHVVATLRDSLNGELAEGHLTLDDLLESLDGCIHRAIARCGSLEVFVGNGKTDGSHTLHTHARGHLQVVKFHVVRFRAVGTSQHKDVVVRHLLLLVRQFEEILINLVEFLAIHFHTIYVQTMLQCGTTATSRQHDGVIVNTHFLRVHDFVSRSILQHTILMNTAGVGKRIPAHNRLVWLHGHVHEARHHTACRVYLCRVDIRLNAQVWVSLEYHGNLFQRGVTSTFTNTVDGHLHLTRTTQHTCHRIGCSHTEVVVTVG